MIGVTPFARLSSVISALAPIPYFDRAAWLDVLPEYNPFKFNSFPANAARQTYDLTTRDRRRSSTRHRADGRLGGLPPILTFQSLVDATVSTEAVVHTLYTALPRNGSELVMFDLNRSAHLDPFIQPSDRALIATLFDRHASRDYTLTVLSNVSNDTLDVAEWHVAAGTTTIETRPLGVAWPADVFSLSHIAMPFPPDDPVYGVSTPRMPSGADPSRAAGAARRALGADRARSIRSCACSYNPFFAYLSDRTVAWTVAR